MKEAECGQMTIFLSLMLISFFLIISVCIEGVYVQTEKADFMEQQLLMGEYAQANYHKELAEQFHVFAIDSRYVSKMNASLKAKLEQNMNGSLKAFQISDQTDITDQDGEILKHQIREYMKYEETSNLLEQIKNSFRGVEDDGDVKQLKSTIQNIGEEESEKDAEEEKETVKAEDPRKGLNRLLKKDILDLVMPNGKRISDREISITYGTRDKKKEMKPDFFQKDTVLELFDDSSKKTALNQLSSEGLGVLYAAEFFRNAVDQTQADGIQYEMEYLISGKSSDRDNLKSVVHQLLAIRFALNYSYLLSDSAKQAEAYTLAAAIANIGASIPGVVEGIKLLLLAAWSYGESIIDVRSLLKGNKIPLVKTEAEWQLSLSNLATLTANEGGSKKGNTYEDYLKILLFLKLEPKEKYLRMMDMMEQRIQEKQSDFQLSESIFSYKMMVKKEIPSLFYGTCYQVENSRIYAY